MAIFKGATWPWAARHSSGTLHYKNLHNFTFGYTETQKKVAAGTATAIHDAINGATSVQTVTSGFTDPDVPRCISVVVDGTAADVEDSSVVVTGTNVEGKTITETFITTGGGTGTINGSKAFRTVTQIVIPAQRGTGCTFSVGTRDILGINHRLYTSNTTTKVYTGTTVYGTLTLDTEPTVVADEVDVELNVVTPDSAPDGSKFYVICYTYDNWADGTSVNDSPEYSTTTSTSSTSTSTSTSTITTSTSSTSISTSSTSISTSSTSTSTSSTSTSTTTTP